MEHRSFEGNDLMLMLDLNEAKNPLAKANSVG